MEKTDTIFLATMWNWQFESEEFQQVLSQFLSGNSKSKKYIISQEPLLNRHPQRNQRFDFFGIGGKTELNTDYLSTNQQLNNQSKQSSRVSYLELSNLPLF